MTYFEFYNLPVSFLLDEAALKKQFFANSKRLHPDFYTLESTEKQAEVLELSTFNTEAYKTLSDFDNRVKYILELRGVLQPEGQNAIPQDFLMDMMDINESLMALEVDFDAATFQSVQAEVRSIEENLLNDIKPVLLHYQDGVSPLSDLEQVKNFYLKKRYLLRIQENLSKFVAALPN